MTTGTHGRTPLARWIPIPRRTKCNVMGVTFHCPNGHLVRAKESLAGKLGVCPDCGVRVRIPLAEHSLESLNEPAAQVNVPLDGAGGGPSQRHPQTPAARHPQTPAARLPETPMDGPRDDALEITLDVASDAAMDAALDAALRQTKGAGEVRTVLHAGPVISPDDPIDQAPAAVWYVRPPDGQQYGPTKGEEIRQWLREGRVPTSALVWREGWDEWKPAGDAFPPSAAERWADGAVAPDARMAPLDAVTAEPPPPITVMTSDNAESLDPRVRRTLQRRRSERSALLWMVFLGAISIVLFAVLLFVLLR